MCGICGIYNYKNRQPVAGQQLQRMNATLAHRGPDDHGTLVDEEFGAAMRRLAIIDLERGHQPLCNEDRTVWAVCNGEIYNFRRLRKTLEASGHRFSTHTDV